IYIANGAAFAGVSLLSASMVADVAEFEAWRTGRRREALYSSLLSWMDKICAAVGTLLCGIAFSLIDFNAAQGSAQPASTLRQMQLLYAAFPLAGAVVAILLLRRYPLSERAMAAVKRASDKRRPGLLAAEGKMGLPAIYPEPA
ncbi:MAG TPA: MFS transporter, partial [Opitutaceae bacterium]|nr:MFS transporter [Opitutaceae bacterium]